MNGTWREDLWDEINSEEVYSKCEAACGQVCGHFEDEYYHNNDTCERKKISILIIGYII